MAESRQPISKLLAVTQRYIRRHWRGVLILRDRVRVNEEAFHLLLAGLVGFGGGLIHLAYHGLSQLIQLSLFGQTGEILRLARAAAPWQRCVIPAVGGLAAGLVLHFGLRFVGKPRLMNLLEVVVAGDGRLPLRAALLRGLSSLLSISTGASIGREGLIVHLAATFSSKLGQWAAWPPYRLRLLVACGAAAGMAAAFDAPVAGAVFAAQIVLGNFSMKLFAPLVFSSVIAAMTSRRFFGIETWYQVPAFDFTRLGQLPWFVILGAISGLVGAAFLKLMQYGETSFEQTRLPIYIRLPLAGLAVGGLAVAYPEVLGNGYGATNEMLAGDFLLPVLGGLFVVKLAATALCVGAGTVGGVFTPTLYLGAALGSFMGGALHLANLGQPVPSGAFGLVGMGSMLAATTRSPLLAIIMVFELSLNYSIMPPLMLACVVSTLVARTLHSESVYTEPLRRRGLLLEGETLRLGAATEQTVGDLMHEPVAPVRDTTPFGEITDRFLTGTHLYLPVVDANDSMIGVVALQDLKQFLNAGQELSGVIALDVMRPPPPSLTPDLRLSDALPIMLASEQRNIPVINTRKEHKLVGAISRVEALSILSEAISASAPSKE